MHPPERRASIAPAPRTRTLLVWAAFGLGGCALAGGCSPMQTAGPSYEPLYGVFPPGGAPNPPGKLAPPASAATPKKADETTGAATGVPALPTALSSTNNATLASHSSLPGHPPTLAIPATRPGAAAPGDGSRSNAAPPESAFPPPNPNPKVVPVPRDTGAALPPASNGGVQAAGSWQPQKLPALGAAPAVSTPAVNVPTAPVALTPETLGAQLARRGYRLVQQKQSALPGGVHLVCVAAPAANPDAPTVFETTGPDYATAAQAILREAERRAKAP